jgi:isopenicillin N synthase-like dioxygenase
VTIDVPIVDLREAGSVDGRRAIAAEVDTALHEHGFMAVLNHGVDVRLIEALYSTMDQFFALPLEEKLATSPSDPNSPRGYTYVGATTQASAHGEATEPDLVETFNAGLEPIPDTPYYREAAEFFAPNLWPASLPALPGLWHEYLGVMQRLTGRIMSAMALALGLDDDWFSAVIDKPMASMTVNRYPALENDLGETQYRGGPHTDYGTITLLTTDGVPGLQLQDADGNWDHVRHVPGAIHVNTGDMLSTWSGGHWRSTWHRVVAPAGPPPHPARTSMAYFHSPNADALISPLPGVAAAGQFEPIRAGTYLRSKLDRYHTARTGAAGND